MLSEEEIKAMMDRAYSGCGDFAELDKADITFARAIERAVLERAEGACEELAEIPIIGGGEWEGGHSNGCRDCADAIRALMPKEES